MRRISDDRLTSEPEYRNIFEAASDGLAIYDLGLDSVVEANRAVGLHQIVGRDIRAAHMGRATLSPEVAQTLVEAAGHWPPGPSLTTRELDVLTLMIEGLNNTQIAAKLTVSPSAIKSHVSSILSKLGVASRTEAVTLALRSGILS